MNAKIKVYTGSVLALSLLLAVLKTLCYLFFFDSALGYFDGTFLVSLTRALTWVGSLWCVSALALFPKDTVAPKNKRAPLSLSLTAVAATLVALAGSGLFVTSLADDSRLMLVCGGLLLLGSAFFWHSAFSPRESSVWLGALAILAYLSIMISSHFDMLVTINSPIKTGVHLSVIAAALLLLSELRLSFEDAMPRAAFALRLFAVLLGLPTAVSHLVLYFSDHAPALSEQSLSPFFSLALLGVAVYAAARLFTTQDAHEVAEQEEEKEFEEI